MSDTETDKAAKPDRKTARAIARAFVHHEVKAANAEATKEDMAAAWKARSAEMTKVGQHVLKALERNGYVVTAPAGDDTEE